MCVDQAPYAVLLNPGQHYRQTRLTRRIQLGADSPSPVLKHVHIWPHGEMMRQPKL